MSAEHFHGKHLQPEHGVSFHERANRIVFQHEMDLAYKFVRFGDKELEQDNVIGAEEAYQDAESIRHWLQEAG